jgi:hypothetical protein
VKRNLSNAWSCLFSYDADEGGGGGEGADVRPEWLPENFQSPEALAESYKELERKLGQQGSQLSEREREMEALRERARLADEYEAYYQQQQRQPAQNPYEAIGEILEDPDRHAQLMVYIAEQNAELARQVEELRGRGPDPAQNEILARYAEQIVREQHPDYDQYRDAIPQIVQEIPGILALTQSPTPSHVAQGLGAALDIAKGRALANTQGQATADMAEAARLSLEQAQTLTGGSSRPATQTADEEYWSRVRAADSGGYGS